MSQIYLELSRFDAIVVSSEVGYEKPAPEIFKIALDQIGVEATNAVTLEMMRLQTSQVLML